MNNKPSDLDSSPYLLSGNYRLKLTKYFNYLAIIFVSVYGFVAFRSPSTYWYGLLMTLALVILILNLSLPIRKRSIEVATNILAFIGVLVLVPWLIAGGPLKAGFYWSAVFVVWAFLLKGKAKAIKWISFYFSLSLFIMIYGRIAGVKIAYSWLEFIQIMFMSAITFALLYFYEEQSALFERLAYKAFDKLDPKR